jgi:hypothetical protein
MLQLGGKCIYCDTGVYFQSHFFRFVTCPACRDQEFMCGFCVGYGWMAVPREEVTAAEVDAWLAEHAK